MTAASKPKGHANSRETGESNTYKSCTLWRACRDTMVFAGGQLTKKQQDNITRETLKTNRHFGLGSKWLKMLKCFHVGSRAIPRRSKRAAASPPQAHQSEAPMATCRVQSTDTPLDRPGTFTPWKKLAKPKLFPRAPAYQHRKTMMSNLGVKNKYLVSQLLSFGHVHPWSQTFYPVPARETILMSNSHMVFVISVFFLLVNVQHMQQHNI